MGSAIAKVSSLEPWIDRLAFHRQHTEHALMNTPQGFTGDEPLERFVTQGELAERQVALPVEPPLAKPDQVFGRVVLRAIDDPQVRSFRRDERGKSGGAALAPPRTSANLRGSKTARPPPPQAAPDGARHPILRRREAAPNAFNRRVRRGAQRGRAILALSSNPHDRSAISAPAPRALRSSPAGQLPTPRPF